MLNETTFVTYRNGFVRRRPEGKKGRLLVAEVISVEQVVRRGAAISPTSAKAEVTVRRGQGIAAFDAGRLSRLRVGVNEKGEARTGPTCSEAFVSAYVAI